MGGPSSQPDERGESGESGENDKSADAKAAQNGTSDAGKAALENPNDPQQAEPQAEPKATAASTPRTSPPRKSPIKSVAKNLKLKNIKPSLNGTGKTFDDDELLPVPTANDRESQTQNIEAIQSAREALAPTPRSPDEEPEDVIEEDEPDTETQADEDELVEVDLQEALISHKLWVDTGGKEGMVMSIEHADLREAELEGIDLSRCGLPFASFRRANCKDAVLRRCNLIAADFIESNLNNTNLAASRLSGARFNNAMLRNTVFLGSDLSNTSFRGQQLFNCDLSGTNLAGADFRDADLSGARGLFAEQIQRARVNANTRLPRNLKLRD